MNTAIFENVKQWFDEYTKSFDLGSEQDNAAITLKIEHSRRVAAEIVDIAVSSGVAGDEVVVAEAAGLLHDAGRFEQYARYRTFQDQKSLNHGLLGVEVVKKSGILNHASYRDRTVIFDAIANHNVKTVPNTLTDRGRLCTRLLRDADKLDILRVVTDLYHKPEHERSRVVRLELPDLPEVSESILRDIMSGNVADYHHLKTLNDFKLLQTGWVYDLQFPRTCVLLAERRYIDSIFETLPQTDAVRQAHEKISAYLRERCASGRETSVRAAS